MSRDEREHSRRDVPRNAAECTPNGEPHTVIVTRQGLGSDGRVWLPFNGAIKTTVVMTNPETAQLCELLDKATMARVG